MEFASEKPIYRQIADYCCECIVRGEWAEEGKAPSVRELSLALTVNTRTVLSAYEILQVDNIIAPRRGMGYFVCADARDRILEARRRDFFENELPALRRRISLLGISVAELTDALNK